MKKISFSLVYQMLLLIIVFSLIPSLIMDQISNYRTTVDLSGVNQEQMLSADQAVHQLLKQLGGNISGVTLSDSQWTEGMNQIAKKNVSFIQSNITNAVGTGGITFAIVTNKAGDVITQSGDQPQLSSTQAFQKLIHNMKGKAILSGLMPTPSGFAAVSIAGVTNNNGTAPPNGYILFGQTISKSSLTKLKDVIGSDIAMETLNNQVTSSNPNITPQTLLSFSSVLKGKESGVFQTFRSHGMINADYSSPIIDILGNQVGLLYTEKPLTASTQVSNDLSNLNNINYVVKGLLLIVLIWILVIRLKPLRKVSEILQSVSEGSLTENVPAIYIKRRDEIGVIATSTSVMIQNLHESVSNMIKEIMEVANKMATASHELSMLVEHNVDTVGNISHTADQMSHRAMNQADNVQNIKHTLQEMGEAIQQMVSNSDRASHMAGQASESASGGQKIIEMIQGKIEHIHNDSLELTHEIQQLSASSIEIRKIVDVISGIAEQTHLLSLNASIEAARAGEHGAGFAVVAQEVQKLAEQSATSAGKIRDLVNTIQKEMNNVISTSTRSGIVIQEGLTAVHEAGGTFTSISQAVHEVASQIMELLSAVEEMSASSQEVTFTMQTVSKHSEDNAEGSKQVSSMTEAQLASMTKLRDSAETLTSMANDLQKAINLFKI